jgi:5-methylcytosine-specific restriction endonuclease McrA
MDYSNYPKTRSDAKSLGAPYYFTGFPCKHGHVALRKTKGSCLECLKVEWEVGKVKRKDYFAAYNRSEVGQQSKARYYETNKEVVIQRALSRNLEDQRRYKAAWKKANPEEVKASTNDRRRRHKNATPKWLSAEQKQEIREIYKEAIRRTKEEGIPYVVDHVFPLRGVEVCGLHVPENLQILTAEENLRKTNKLLDTPEQSE